MCGRFTLRTPPNVVAMLFDLDSLPDLAPRYNVAPTQEVAVVRAQLDSKQRELVQMRWGLIPSWAKDESIGNRMINARSETAATKPSFRSAFRRRRCLIVADGFYEWQATGGKKQPFYIRRPDEQPFGFAGLWDLWRHGGLEIASCTILTTNANNRLAALHDRMPVILDKADYGTWLDPDNDSVETLGELLQPADDDTLVAGPVSTLVNSPKNDTPECVVPLKEP